MIAVHLGGAKGGGRIGHVNLSCQDGGQSRILRHENHRDLLYLRRAAVIVLICLENNLLLGLPLHEPVRAGANGRKAIVLPVSMLRHNPHRGQSVEEN